LVGADGNAPRALTSLPLGTVLQTAVGGNTQISMVPVFPPTSKFPPPEGQGPDLVTILKHTTPCEPICMFKH
jgi:hypothetical protein